MSAPIFDWIGQKTADALFRKKNKKEPKLSDFDSEKFERNEYSQVEVDDFEKRGIIWRKGTPRPTNSKEIQTKEEFGGFRKFLIFLCFVALYFLGIYVIGYFNGVAAGLFAFGGVVLGIMWRNKHRPVSEDSEEEEEEEEEYDDSNDDYEESVPVRAFIGGSSSGSQKNTSSNSTPINNNYFGNQNKPQTVKKSSLISAPSYVNKPQTKYLLQRYHGYRWLTTDEFYQENASIYRAEMLKNKIPDEHIRVVESTNGRTGSTIASF